MAQAQGPRTPGGMPLTTKANPPFKEFVGHLARSDADHDFRDGHAEYSYSDQVAANMNKGLNNVGGLTKTNERGSLWSVLTDLSGDTIDARENAVSGFFNRLPEAPNSTTAFHVGYRGERNAAVHIHNYTAHRVNIDDYKARPGTPFRDACGLQGEATLVVDFSQHGFIDTLKAVGTGESYINVVTNPQTINDAGPKTKFNDPVFVNSSLRSIVDITNKPTIYSAWNPENPDIYNMFLTSYQFELTPLKFIKSTIGRTQKYEVNLTVSSDGASKTSINNAKINNGKVEIWKKIKSLFKNFTTNVFKVNEGLQRKRLGDWGQATSCFTLNNKDYKSWMPGEQIDRRPNLNIVFAKTSVYFVTHDYIAAAYALLIGANLIFLTNRIGTTPNRVYIFKNLAFNEAFDSDSYMRGIVLGKGKLVPWLIRYNDQRTTSLRDLSGNITRHIGELNTVIGSVRPVNPDALKRSIFETFRSAFVYQQVEQHTPDVTDIIEVLNPPVPELNANRAHPSRTTIRKMYEYFMNGQKIENKYSDQPLDAEMQARIKSSNIFLAIKNWTYSKQVTGWLSPKRLGFKVNAGNNIVNDQDKLAHLAFLKSINNDKKLEIYNVFSNLLNRLLEQQQFLIGNPTSRSYDQSVLAFKELCEQVRIFLGTDIDNQVLAEPETFTTVSGIKIKINIVQADNNLSEKRVLEENQDSNGYPMPDDDPSGDKYSYLTAQLEAELDLQRGGLLRSNRVFTQINSLKEMTHELLTAHFVLKPQTWYEYLVDFARVGAVIASGSVAVVPAAISHVGTAVGSPALSSVGSAAASVVGSAVQSYGTVSVYIATAAAGAALGIATKAYLSRASGEHPAITQNLDPKHQGGAKEPSMYSPGFPIYIVLEGLCKSITELKYHPDYDDYVTYFLLLESMNDMLNENTNQVIRFALREILATFISTQIGRETIAPLFEELGDEYRLFPLITTTIAADVCGSFVDYDEGKEEVIVFAIKIIQSDIVRGFVSNVIALYRTKSRAEFYIGEEYNILGFMQKANQLQTKIADAILETEIKDMVKQAEEQGITVDDIRRSLVPQKANITRKSANLPYRAPLERQVYRNIPATAGGKNKRKTFKNRR